MLTLAGLTMATAALLALSLLLPGPQVCGPSTVTTVAQRAQPVPAGRQPGCAIQQNEPARQARAG